MMQQSAIVHDANRSHQRGSAEYSGDLLARGPVEGEKDSQQHRAVHREPAQQGYGLQMHFAWSREVDHADTQCQRADRDR